MRGGMRWGNVIRLKIWVKAGVGTLSGIAVA